MKKEQDESPGSVSRSFSLKVETSELLNRVQQAEKRRPFSHILGEAVEDYAAKNHPDMEAE